MPARRPHRIARLEQDKLIAKEKAASGSGPQRPFDEMFELALSFLSSPWKLWASDRLEDKRIVLRLTFAERLPYRRGEGFRTPKTTLPFKVLGEFCGGKREMARRRRFELLTPRFVVWCSIQLSYRRLAFRDRNLEPQRVRSVGQIRNRPASESALQLMGSGTDCKP